MVYGPEGCPGGADRVVDHGGSDVGRDAEDLGNRLGQGPEEPLWCRLCAQASSELLDLVAVGHTELGDTAHPAVPGAPVTAL